MAGEGESVVRVTADFSDVISGVERLEQLVGRAVSNIKSETTTDTRTGVDPSGFNQAYAAAQSNNPIDVIEPAANKANTAALKASIDEELTAHAEYTNALVLSAKSQADTNLQVQSALAADGEYIASRVLATKIIAERNAVEQEALAADAEYAKSLAAAAAATTRIAAEKATLLATDPQYVAGEAELNRANLLLKLSRLEGTALQQGSNDFIAAELEARGASVAEIQKYISLAQINNKITQAEIASTDEVIAANAQYAVAKKRAALLQAEADKFALGEAGLGAAPGSKSLLQRIGFGGAGGGGDGADALGSIAGKIGPTIGYALAAAAVFKVTQSITEAISESNKLQVQLGQLHSSATSMGVGGEAAFNTIRDSILKTSVATGTLGSDLANIAIQLTGINRDSSGAVDTGLVTSQLESISKFAKVSGTPLQETLDSSTAAVKEFGVTAKEVFDSSVDAENKFGVKSGEVLKILGDAAPLLKENGFSLAQSAALIGTISQRSGLPSQAIADGLNRILPTLQQNSAKIAEIFNGNQDLKGDPLNRLAAAFREGNVPAIFNEVADAMQHLSSQGQQDLTKAVAGDRNSKVFQAFIDGKKEYDAAVGNNTSVDALDKRWAEFSKTLTAQLAILKQKWMELVEAVVNAGLIEGLTGIVEKISLMVDALGKAVELAGKLDGALSHVPGYGLAKQANSYLNPITGGLNLGQDIYSFFGGGDDGPSKTQKAIADKTKSLNANDPASVAAIQDELLKLLATVKGKDAEDVSKAILTLTIPKLDGFDRALATGGGPVVPDKSAYAAALEKQTGTAINSVTDAQQLYNEGLISIGELDKFYAEQIKFLRETADHTNPNNTNDKQADTLAKSQSASDSKAILDAVKARAKYRTLTGTGDVNAQGFDEATIRDYAAAIQDPTLDHAGKTEAAAALVDLLQKQVNFLASSEKDAKKRNDLIKNGISILDALGPEAAATVQELLVADTLRVDPGWSTAVADIIKHSGDASQKFDDFMKEAVQVANFTGLTIKQAILNLIDEQIQSAQTAIANIGAFAGFEGLDAAVSNLDSLKALKDRVGNLGDPGHPADRLKPAGIANKTATAPTAAAIRKAQEDYLRAQIETDPVALAEQNIRLADQDIADATDQAARFTALAAKVRAERALKKAMEAIVNSQLDLLKAQASAGDDVVGVAEISLRQAQEKLRQAQETGDKSAILQAQAGVVAASADLNKTRINDEKSHEQFLLDTGKITNQEYLAFLVTLEKDPTLTKKQREDLEREIYSLRNKLGADFQFNLPTQLGLPTLYEARRSTQGNNFSASTGAGADNRQITINFQVNNSADYQTAYNDLLSAIQGPSRYGARPRSY